MRPLYRALVLSVLLAARAFAASSTTFIWAPNDPGDTTGNFSVAGGADVALCVRFVPPVGITNATKIAYGIASGVTLGACSVGVYNADGSSRIATSAESSTQSCTAAGVKTASSLSAFSLTPGTKYTLCICTSGTTGSYTALNWSTTAGHAGDLVSAFVTNIGTAANGCSSGAVPTTTGTLTATRHNPPLVVFSVE